MIEDGEDFCREMYKWSPVKGNDFSGFMKTNHLNIFILSLIFHQNI